MDSLCALTGHSGLSGLDARRVNANPPDGFVPISRLQGRELHKPSLASGFMRGFPAPHPDGVNANPLLADWSGTPCRNDGRDTVLGIG
ncbi:MAG: hypothetical protein ACXWTW_08420 [Methylobacter sp.]